VEIGEAGDLIRITRNANETAPRWRNRSLKARKPG
jgi:hypothetical protein